MGQQEEQISARLRAIRRSKKLTLSEIESLSKGKLSAISLGSYERGDRGLSVKKAIEIADFYELPLAYLLDGKNSRQEDQMKIVLDLRRLRKINTDIKTPLTLTLQIITSFASGIIGARQDFNGEVLSLRKNDCEYLAISIGCNFEELQGFLTEQGLLMALK